MNTARLIAGVVLIGMAYVRAALGDDGGGRDVSVAMFSTRELHAVTVSAAGANAWTATCERCAHHTLVAPLHFPQMTEIFAGGSIRVTDDASHEQRTAVGLWHLRTSGPNAEVDLVLTLPSERYVQAVLQAEAAVDEPGESLRALAIVARTYALNGSHYRSRTGHLPADLCDSTQCQAMRFGGPSQAVEDAVFATAGETLWRGSSHAEVFFSENCGGQTEAAAVVWPTIAGTGLLRGHADPYCVRRDRALWHAELPIATLSTIAQTQGWHLPRQIVGVRITQRSSSGRALRIEVRGVDGTSDTLAASALRFGVGRSVGWNRLRSDWYDVGLRNGQIVFDGRGYGHGVGLCQTGAAQMAVEGSSYRDIINFYFAGLHVGVTASDSGWKQVIEGPLVLRAVEGMSAQRRLAVHEAWTEAERRFPVGRAVHAQIVFAPTTEVFRQLSEMPGWALASTRGSTVVLQPYGLLMARSRSIAGTLLHEMLHVRVESEATDLAPLWLREGLVEVLAGERFDDGIPGTSASVESDLRHAESLRASERAHRDAGALVRKLVARYGMSSVRGWLATGAPAGVAYVDFCTATVSSAST